MDNSKIFYNGKKANFADSSTNRQISINKHRNRQVQEKNPKKLLFFTFFNFPRERERESMPNERYEKYRFTD